MAVDFSAFDKKVDQVALQEQIDNAKDFEDVPDGTYIVSIEKMEIKLTKSADKVMFSLQCKIKDGDQKNRLIFFNRVISGNRSSETWNDGKAIKSVITMVNKLLADDEEPVKFVNYSDFAEQILDVYQEVHTAVELEVEYSAKAFNSISIKEVYDL